MKIFKSFICIFLMIGCATSTKKEIANIKPETEKSLQQSENVRATSQSSSSLTEFIIEKTVIDKGETEIEAIAILGDIFFYTNGNSFCKKNIKTGKTNRINIEGYDSVGIASHALTKFFPAVFTKKAFDENITYEEKDKIYDFDIVCLDTDNMSVAWEVKDRGVLPNIIIRDNMAVISYNNRTRFIDCSTGTYHEVKEKNILGFDVWIKLDDGCIMSVLYYDTYKNPDPYQRFIQRRDEKFNIVWTIENGAPGAGSLPISETYEFEKYPGRFFAKRSFEESRQVTCYSIDGREIWTIRTTFSMEVFDVENGIFICQQRKHDIDDSDCTESISAYSLENGKLVWESEPVRSRRCDTFSTTSNLTKDYIYVCSAYEIFKIDKKNGKIIWMLDSRNKQLAGLSMFEIEENAIPTDELSFSCMDYDKYMKSFTVDTMTGKIVNPVKQKSEIDTQTANSFWSNETILDAKDGEAVMQEALLDASITNNVYIAKYNGSEKFVILDVKTGNQIAEVGQSIDKPRFFKILGLMHSYSYDSYFNGENYCYLFGDDNTLELLIETEVTGGFQLSLWKISKQLRP